MSFTLAIDAMGGDFGPCITVPASIKALSYNKKMNIFLVGDPQKISILMGKINSNLQSRLKIIPSFSFINNDIEIFQAIRHSYGSSMRIALELVKKGKAQACISAGNTGALMSLSKIIIKPLKYIKRPALMSLFPNNKGGKTLVLDLGANIHCNSEILVQFAIMGSILAKKILKKILPKVALLNIGKEDNKGLKNIRNAHKILKNFKKINYIGYIEGNDLLTGKTDVLVCDGFVGNIMLKTIEGIIKIFFSFFQNYKNNKKEKWYTQFILSFFKKSLLKEFYFLNPDKYNGACFLGLNNIVVKSHGSANENSFFSAIQQTEKILMYNIPYLISKFFATTILPKE